MVVDKIAEFFALKEYPVRFWYKTQEKLDDSINVFIFDNLQEKAYTAKETKVAKARGYILPEADARWSIMIVLSQLEHSVSEDVESVLMWHIATTDMAVTLWMIKIGGGVSCSRIICSTFLNSCHR